MIKKQVFLFFTLMICFIIFGCYKQKNHKKIVAKNCNNYYKKSTNPVIKIKFSPFFILFDIKPINDSSFYVIGKHHQLYAAESFVSKCSYKGNKISTLSFSDELILSDIKIKESLIYVAYLSYIHTKKCFVVSDILQKCDFENNVQWKINFEEEKGPLDAYSYIEIANDNSIFFVTSELTGKDSTLNIYKIDEFGNIIYKKQISDNKLYFPDDIECSPHGLLLLFHESGSNFINIAKFSLTGKLLWRKNYRVANGFKSQKIVELPNKKIVFSGCINKVVKENPKTEISVAGCFILDSVGNIIKKIELSESESHIADLKRSAADDIYLSGIEYDNNLFFISKINVNGTILWRREFKYESELTSVKLLVNNKKISIFFDLNNNLYFFRLNLNGN